MRITSLIVVGLLLVPAGRLAAEPDDPSNVKEEAPKEQKKPVPKPRLEREAEKIFNKAGGKESGELTLEQFQKAQKLAEKAIKSLTQERVIGGAKPLEKKDDPGDLSKNEKVTLEEFKLYFQRLAFDADSEVRAARAARHGRGRAAPADVNVPQRDYQLERELARQRQWDRWERDLYQRPYYSPYYSPFGIPGWPMGGMPRIRTTPPPANLPIGSNPNPVIPRPTPAPPRPTPSPPPRSQPKDSNSLADSLGRI